MPFKPGQSGNPHGRPRKPATKFKLSIREIAEQKNIDTLVLLRAIVSAEKFDISTRLQAAAILAPFQHSKAVRTISKPFDLPDAGTVEQATANIAKIARLAARGKIGLDEMNDLIGAQKSYIEAKVGLDIEGQMLELRQIVERLSVSARPIDAMISGGLPVPPGLEGVLMPALSPPANGGKPEDGA